ncbi:hypothetical protein SELMODRAFT_449217 [Selaginella moellendorffii]|uniref:UV radiation resistance-associated gene protein n=2 Tax=Selaginella moellendorffii TaxID=88036 RepID=D8TDS9_SELML|nr:hypothetical protein SELMODRAFT_449217 [Selaginella moellendorffii]
MAYLAVENERIRCWKDEAGVDRMDKVEDSVATVLTQCCSELGLADASEDGEKKKKPSPPPQLFQWEEYENSLARLCGLATLLSKARASKESAARKLETLVETVNLVELKRIDALESLHKKVELRRKAVEDSTSSLEEKNQQLKDARDKLALSGNSLLHAARSLNAAQFRLQEAQKLLSGDGGYGRLARLKGLLTVRRRAMAAQVAALYPLIPCTNEKKCPPLAHAGEGDSVPLTISGLHVIAPVKKEAALFTDKREYETSATALGHVAHMLSLLSRFLDIRLRYPVRYRASRSYIQDPSPPTEPSTSGGAIVLPAVENQLVEFPLFSDGQEPTRAAYAVFLLNKDLEQILDRFETASAGPRHVLPNLKRILKVMFRDGRFLA